jgi:hypothetical protein
MTALLGVLSGIGPIRAVIRQLSSLALMTR